MIQNLFRKQAWLLTALLLTPFLFSSCDNEDKEIHQPVELTTPIIYTSSPKGSVEIPLTQYGLIKPLQLKKFTFVRIDDGISEIGVEPLVFTEIKRNKGLRNWILQADCNIGRAKEMYGYLFYGDHFAGKLYLRRSNPNVSNGQ